MIQRHINYLNMADSVMQFLNSNADQWNSNAHITKQVQDIQETTDKIRQAALVQDGSKTTGLTGEKRERFGRMTLNTGKLVRKLRAYAKLNKDAQLLQKVDHSISSIKDGSDEESLIRCENVVNVAEGIKDSLVAEFALNESLIGAIRDDIAAIRILISTRTDTGSEGVVATSAIKDNIAMLHAHFDILDDLVYGIIDAEEFLQLYANNRQIIDR